MYYGAEVSRFLLGRVCKPMEPEKESGMDQRQTMLLDNWIEIENPPRVSATSRTVAGER